MGISVCAPGEIAVLERPGERLLVGPAHCFDRLAPPALLQDRQVLEAALRPYLTDGAALAALRGAYQRISRDSLGAARLAPPELAGAVTTLAQRRTIGVVRLPDAGVPSTRLPSAAAARPDVVAAGVPAVAAAAPRPVSQWSLAERFSEVLRLTLPKLPAEMQGAFSALLAPETLIVVVGTLVVWAGSHAAGVGFIADAALIAIGYAMVGWSIFGAIRAIAEFIRLTVSAGSHAELDRAAEALAEAVAAIGVGTLVALLTRGAARNVRARAVPRVAEPTQPVRRTPAEVLAANRAAGRAAERQAAIDLASEGNTILGSQVTVRTSQGNRVIDHLIQTPDGRIMAVEVKSGNAVRNAAQLAKDAALASEGGVVTGVNAPAALRGQHVILETIERHY
ncbi:MAG: hypothetical protein QHC78_09005 [Pigmentiphaga sp.]|uniref:hypothetical protein n=1 Tax=Pigmentiphaga sp. TaxID=1977564 RepID=UPI0029AE51C8|nr:hypothetical protein [Pigmentiphaga sp.]MDX3905812.1 hypothetical protein [Pigmentiphaga sp.]